MRGPTRDGSTGVLSRIISLFLGSGDPEREKRRLLKLIAKDLQRQRFKFYKPRSGEALGGLARFFFEIYKVVGPAQTLLQGADDSAALRTVLIEMNTTEEQRQLAEEFSEPVMRERARSMDTRQLTAHVKDAMVGYFSGFDSVVVKRVNETYSLIHQLVRFVKYDYYFVLRKFDSGLQEGNFGLPPRFESINAEYVTDDIKDFLEVAGPLDVEADWGPVFDALREYKGVDAIDRGAWKRILNTVGNGVRTGVFVKVVQHVDQDPSWAPDATVARKYIVETYLNTLKTQVEGIIQKLARERRTQKVDQLVHAVFGTGSVHRARNYTESANLSFAKKMLAGYQHVEAFNYLKAFLVDYFKADVRQVISDLFIVRGQWSDNVLSQQLSDAYYSIMNTAQRVVEFDDSLGEEGELGAKLKKASGRVVERDSSTVKQLRQILTEVNDAALSMVHETAANLITMGKVIKLLIDDTDKERSELVQNWKDLQAFSEQPVRDQLVSIYRRSYHFVQLMQVYAKK